MNFLESLNLAASLMIWVHGPMTQDACYIISFSDRAAQAAIADNDNWTLKTYMDDAHSISGSWYRKHA